MPTTSERVLAVALALVLGCSRGPTPAQEAEGHYVQGTQRYLQGDFTGALASFERVRQLAPTDVRLPAARGEVLLSMGKLNEALAAFSEASARQPSRATHWSRLGYIQSQLGQVRAARASLEQALKLAPEDGRALEALGRLELGAGNRDEAFELLSRASRRVPERDRAEVALLASGIVMEQQRPADVVRFLEQAREEGISSAELLSALGDAQVELGALRPALGSYTAAAKLAPRDASLWEVVGALHLQLREHEAAIDAFKRSIAIEDRTSAEVALAQVYWAREEHGLAREALDRALDAAPRAEPGELVELARLLALVGRQADAIRLVQHVAAEPEPSRDAALQLKVLGLARQLGAKDVAREACARARDAGTACP